MADDYAYDSFGGPTLLLRPEDLDRLDASQIEPSESPSLAQDIERCRRLEESIHGTISAIKANAPSHPVTYHQAPSNNYLSNYFTSPEAIPAGKPLAVRNVALTPSSSNDKPHNVYQESPKYKPDFPAHGQILTSLSNDDPRDYTAEDVKQSQAERNHRLHMEKLQSDIDELMKQHANVIKLKTDVEKGLQLELEITRKDCRKEKEARESEKERHSRQVRDLKERIRSLERRLDEVRDHHRGIRRSRAVSFADDYNEDLGRDSVMTRNDYERKLVEVQRDHDAKIANLVRQFDREKAAALEILKSKVKAEVSLLIPRIKDRCHKAYAERFQTLRDSLADKFRQHYEDKIRIIRDENSSDRRVWQRQVREQVERAREEIEQKLKAKYEMRLMDMKNECERRILQRLREGSSGYGRRPTRERDCDDSFDRYYGFDSDDSFV